MLGTIAMLPALVACDAQQPEGSANTTPAAGMAAPTPATAGTPAQAGAEPDAARPAAPVDAKALAALDAMGKHLRSLDRFAVQADTSTDMVMEDGQKITLGGKVAYKVATPAGLFADVAYDRTHRQYYFDGKNLTIYAPSMKFYGQIAAAGTIADLMDKADSAYGVDLPLADLFFWGSPQAKDVPITSAALVGPTTIGEHAVDHYAIRQGDVDWQLWVDRGAKPLPRRLIYTAWQDPARPQFSAELSWDTAPALGATAFQFTPPEGAHRISVVPGVRELVATLEPESSP